MSNLDQRIEAMHRSDTRIAWAFVVGLWCAMIFVAIATWDLAPNGTARVLLLIAGAVILLFNTAAIWRCCGITAKTAISCMGWTSSSLMPPVPPRGRVMAKYTPPVQSKVSQFIDVIVLMVLTFGALYVPLFLGLAGGSKTSPERTVAPDLGKPGPERGPDRPV